MIGQQARVSNRKVGQKAERRQGETGEGTGVLTPNLARERGDAGIPRSREKSLGVPGGAVS